MRNPNPNPNSNLNPFSTLQAMRNGEMLLLDELSLAEDAVIERLNSVLENSRTITLTEHPDSNGEGGCTAVEKVVASPGFLLVATMNPGGDFGKRELSPALRNRFTEIYVPAIMSEEDLSAIAIHHVV